jgi:structural maintenance of chromosome 3 (chondroitin sulfate proteoglycan 6)
LALADRFLPETKKVKVEEVLQYIEERLQQLESEKEELGEYQTLDKEKRCLEYTIYNADLITAVDKLSVVDRRREELSEEVDSTRSFTPR